MNEPLYDRIGASYNRTRQADPNLAASLANHLHLKPGGRYLDLACGTGNYTAALAERGGCWLGLDFSLTMLTPARDRGTFAPVRGRAEALPFKNERLDGVLVVLALHHFTDLAAVFTEIHRVLKPGARLVAFTGCPEQMRGYWLNHYFPKMMADSCKNMPHRMKLSQHLDQAGFKKPLYMPWFMPDTHQDLFLYAGKDRPELYLQPAVRAGISSFSHLIGGQELGDGLWQLEEDLGSGAWQKLRREYADTLGDYLVVIAEKPSS